MNKHADLKEVAHIPDVQREYIPKHEGEILDAVLRGHDIEFELIHAIRVLYAVEVVYVNRHWLARDVREVTYGLVIMNPTADDGSFPHLTSLLKWCNENRS